MRRTILFLLSLLLLTTAGALAQETPAITIHTTLPGGSTFTLGIHCRQPIAIDWGDGERVDYESNNYGIDGIQGQVKGDGWIRIWSEAPEGILSLYVGNEQRSQQVDSLDLSQLRGLKFLYCQNNLLSRLDITPCFRLMELNVAANRLSELDLRNAPLLDMLVCQNNQLKTLDLSPVQSLMALRCEYNKISSLDLRHFKKLTVIHCEGNPLTQLDISQNEALQQIFAQETQITSWDLTPHSDLRVLNLSNIPGVNVTWGAKDELRQIFLNHNGLASLSLPLLPQLDRLEIQDNELTSISLAGIPMLKDFRCSNNKLQQLDLSPVGQLDYLFAEGNQLSQLDLSHVKGIKELLLSYNKLSQLDLSHCPELYLLWLTDNPIQELDIRPVPKLFSLFLDGCQLSDSALETILKTLPDIHEIQANERTAWWKKWLLIKRNPLAQTPNAQLAVTKGWQVDLLDAWPGRYNGISSVPEETQTRIIRTGERLNLYPRDYAPTDFVLYLYDMSGALIATATHPSQLSRIELGDATQHYLCITVIDGVTQRVLL
ncbi:leucine-rich repeat domain-containing protein [Porphyromonas sp.]|uniref:leucine-rich repeat domain-containing protein n=1 Tax=Porphyromonas sp. TaxID=1924944 RepID=UPI003AB4BE59